VKFPLDYNPWITSELRNKETQTSDTKKPSYPGFAAGYQDQKYFDPKISKKNFPE